MSINNTQRFSKDQPCPVCEGFDGEVRGTGRRCFGFLSSDGQYAHCTREEHAGQLERNSASDTFAHRLEGTCLCGHEHGPNESRKTHKSGPSKNIIAAYKYCDEQGTLLYEVVRYEPKTFKARRPDGNGGWLWNLKNARRVPYRLPDVVQANRNEWVFVVEGEKDADRLTSLGFIATTNVFGAKKWQNGYTKFFRRRRVVILKDNDTDGCSHAKRIVADLHGEAAVIRMPTLPGLEPKGDVSDWLDSGRTASDLKRVVEDTPDWCPDSKTNKDKEDETAPNTGESQAARVIEFIEDMGVALFHDSSGDTWAQVEVENHHEIWSCSSKRFRQWLAGLAWKREKKAFGSDALSSALNVIQAKARFDGEEHELHNRVARHCGAIWYDLGDPEWKAVRIDAQGWVVVKSPPILFRRFAHQAPQVDPRRGGDLGQILSFVNVRDTDHQLLLLVYLVSCLVPDIPHPIPVLHGGQGAAKTTLARMLRRIVDPSQTETLGPAKDPTEIVQQLSHHWAPYYDNLTQLPQWMSDILCRASTGGGFSKRKLYTDEDDLIVSFRRCPGLNGINIAAQQPDLLDRCLLFGLEPIPDHKRRNEEDLWEKFEAVRPQLLGAAFDALSHAMRIKPDIRVDRPPRMADFAVWGSAIAQALGRSQQEFLDAFSRNFSVRNEEILTNDLIATAIRHFMESKDAWEGTPSELLSELETVAAELKVSIRSKEWPKAPNALSRRLNILAGNLIAAGIDVTKGHGGGNRKIVVRRKSLECVNGDGSNGLPRIPSQVSSSKKRQSPGPNDDSDGNDDVSRTLKEPNERRNQEAKRTDDIEGPGNTVTIVTTVTKPRIPLFSGDGIDDDTSRPGSIPSSTLSSSQNSVCSDCHGTRFWTSAMGSILCQSCGTRFEPDGAA